MRALLDANVLYSIALTDTLLTLADAGLVAPLWTEQILTEAERGARRRRRERGEDTAHLRRRFQAMRAAFDEATIDLLDYGHLIPEMPNHEGDRHVLAAAVAAQADVLVTRNIGHFPSGAIAGLPVGEVMTPDSFLCTIHDAAPTEVVAALRSMLSNRHRPSMTMSDLVQRLVTSGAVHFASRLSVPAAADSR